MSKARRLKIIACEILYREVCLCAANSRNVVDVQFMPKGLHDLESAGMVAKLQAQIDETAPELYDAVLLGYALCNNGVVGLTARQRPLVIPRAHDCITLFFGSRKRYDEYFSEHPGTYFKTTGWSERDFITVPNTVMEKLGLKKTYREYVEKYGEDNARYIMEQMGAWKQNYTTMAFIDMGIANGLEYDKGAEAEAHENGWEYRRLEGDLRLIRNLLDGEWNENEFLVLQPGESIVASNDDRIVAVKTP
ncbi:MAG: DUF1638 domain-containing protein [Planctomycetes bacterium]|nr:DUF1638 domain-containing protein [Planctomycetota bacterium]